MMLQTRRRAAAHLDALDVARRDDGAAGGLVASAGGQQHTADGLGHLAVDLDEHAVTHGLHGLELRGKGGWRAADG